MDKIVRTIDGYNWLVRGEGYSSDFEPLRNYEVTVFDIIREIGEKSKEEGKETVFVDVGANSGAHSIRAAKIYDKVIAIEPDPSNLIVLKKNIEINKLRNVKVVETGCSDRKGTVKFLSAAANAMVTDNGDITINVDTLDNILIGEDDEGLIDNEIENMTVKIDVEGHEEKVIHGARRVIDKYRPAIMVEHHEYRGDLATLCQGMKERIRCYLGNAWYTDINIDFVHWLYISTGTGIGDKDMKYNLDKYQEAIFAHWFNFVIDNLKNGREWYFGLRGIFWHGMGIIDFYKQLPSHILAGEKEWVEIDNVEIGK